MLLSTLTSFIKKILPYGLTLIPLITIVIVAIKFESIITSSQKIISEAGIFGPIIFIILKASTYVLAPITGESIKVLAGMMFGFWEGIIFTSIGDLIGGSINFWIARAFGLRALAKFISLKSIVKIKRFTRHISNWRILLFYRVFLSAVYDFISYAAGFSKISYIHYVIVSLIGGLASTTLWVAFGSTLRENRNVALIILIIIIMLFILVWRFRNVFKEYSETSSKKENHLSENESKTI